MARAKKNQESTASAAPAKGMKATKEAEKTKTDVVPASTTAEIVADGQQGDVEFKPVSEPTSEKPDDVSTDSSTTTTAKADEGGADGVVICNSGKQNEVIILGGVRKFLAPREIWRVPSELMDAFEKYAKTPYFQAVEAEGILTVSGAVTRRMKDPDMKTVRTPKPPATINPEVSYEGKKTTVEMTLEEE